MYDLGHSCEEENRFLKACWSLCKQLHNTVSLIILVVAHLENI